MPENGGVRVFIQNLPKTALICQGRSISYGEMLGRASAWSRLALSSIAPGDRVVVFAENSPEWVFAFFSVWRRRGVPVPVDCLATAEDLAYVFDDCTPAAVWGSVQTRAVVAAAVDLARHKPKVNILEEMPDACDEASHFDPANVDATAVILYTSGTTGSPKGVMLSYANLSANIAAVMEDGIFGPDDRTMILLPFHHILPLQGTLLAPLHAGGLCVFCLSRKAEEIVGILQKHQVTVLVGVPRLYALIAKGIRDKINANLPARLLFALAGRLRSPGFSRRVFGRVHQQFGGHLKALVCGGAAVDDATWLTFRTLGFDILVGYGMTETAPIISFPRLGFTSPLGASGRALPGVEIRVDEGEICVRGANVMKGYWMKPEETARILRGGWLHTGDLGSVDANGFVFITGRLKEEIALPTGKKINPEELETKLKGRCPLLADVGVFMADGLLQAVFLPDFARVRAAGTLNLEEHLRWEVLDSFNKTVAPHKKILQFTVVKQELPRTRMGKLRRFALPAMVTSESQEAKAARHAAFQEYPEYATISQFLAHRLDRPVWPDDHLEIDLGMDSLDKVELLVFLKESFGLAITEQELLDCQGVERLAAFVRDHKLKFAGEEVDWKRILIERPDSIRADMPRRWPFQGGVRLLGKLFFSLWFRFRHQGAANLPDRPCIIAPNHQSFLDGFLVAAAMPPGQFKRTCFYAKAKHFSSGWRRFVARHNNVIVSDVNKDLTLSIQKIAEALASGKNVIVFPEGTRSRDGRIGPFKDLFAIISRELDVPVVPVAISGAFDALPHGGWLPKWRQPISVSILPAVEPGSLDYGTLRTQVHEAIAAAASPERK